MKYQPSPDYRLVRIQVGDTLQRIALRELSDAGRWVEILYLNDLRSPYIVATPADASANPGTLYYGQSIKIPAPSRNQSATAYEDLYGQDIDLVSAGGLLSVEDGDLQVIAGLGNLRQAIRHRLLTELGELLYHPDYGCQIHLVLGQANDEIRRLLSSGFVRRALGDEPRIRSVISVKAVSVGENMEVESVVEPVAENTPVDLNLVYPLER